MFKANDRIIYSASDIVNFLECEHISTLDRLNMESPLPETPDGEDLLLLQRRGSIHEDTYLEKLRSKGLTVVDLSQFEGSVQEQSEATIKAMKTGADIIFQSTFQVGSLFGHPDFLRKVPTPSRLGNFSYEVIDTKLARIPKAHFVVQLCFYSDMLTVIQGLQPKMMSIVLGDQSEVNFRFDRFRQYFRTLLFRFQENVSKNEPTYPEKNAHCPMCRWRGLCEQRWLDDDHLNQVAGISKIQMNKLRDAGIHSLEQLANLDESIEIKKISPEALSQIISQARLQLEKRKTGANIWELRPLDPDRVRGFYRLPMPNEGDLFFDMEGDPLILGGLEYLFGVYYFENGEPTFKAFWAHNRDQERHAFESFMDFVNVRLNKFPDAHIYHYASYEESALKRLMSTHGVRESQVDDLLRNQKLVDLYKVVRESIRVSEPSYSIKNLEVFYAQKRSEEVKDALSSIIFYERWLENNDQKLLDHIEEYNMVDCRSTYQLRQWLLTLRPANIEWKLGTKDTSDKKAKPKSDKTVKLEKELEAYRKKLHGDLSPSDEAREFRELVFYLLDFHRREKKPSWWAAFNRQTMTDEQLIDDPECIAGLDRTTQKAMLTAPLYDGWVYEYPEQEFKLQAGDRAVHIAALKENVLILDVDEDERLVELKLSRSETPPEKLSIAVGLPINTDTLTAAIFRFADSVIADSKFYPAIEAILKRNVPIINGHEIGSCIVDPDNSDINRVIQSVVNLKDSYIFIQGPPGTGKTYTGSHIIAELLRRKFRVGVSSNSHKAINNLLRHVEKRAVELGIRFRGLKKSTDDPNTHFNGRFISDVFSNRDILDSKADLVAGTAWLFSRMERDLDFLFVDEAGQVSLANLVSMGVSSRNIVLLGDQMQLGQPIQGAHPGRSGESTLEYLLDGGATISPEKGIFLDTTWRMRLDVCGFISEAVYDSKLKPHPRNQNQMIILNEFAHPCLKPSGLSFVPICHDGCSQKSEEEAELIREIIDSLLGQRYRDRDGKERPLTLDNIMVVAPYNMQVNLLKRILPAGARVGTVDKFQGQESEVVIISMTTSSGEYLPRRIEFLYSKNRLNVAISRARTLSILVVNLLLLSIKCNTTEQMELVNTLCWARYYRSVDKAYEIAPRNGKTTVLRE